jgi:hypothetical protein
MMPIPVEKKHFFSFFFNLRKIEKGDDRDKEKDIILQTFDSFLCTIKKYTIAFQFFFLALYLALSDVPSFHCSI